jgi:hypothetical protein
VHGEALAVPGAKAFEGLTILVDAIDGTCVAHSRTGAQKLARTIALRNAATWYYLYHPCMGPILKKEKGTVLRIPPGIELADSIIRRINLQLRYSLNREIEFLLAQAVRPLRSRSRVERQERKS